MQRRVRELEEEVARLRARLAGGHARAVGRRPIFVGGTGRSGTWVMGRLLGNHPDYVTVRTELRFHSSEQGLRDLVRGEEAPEAFVERVRDRWFGIKGASGNPKGLFMLATRDELRRASRRLVEDAEADVTAAARSFVHELVDPFALGRGAIGWVETTPDNASASDVLTRVFPDALVVVMSRDGRDVASSVHSMPWGPDSIVASLDWWEERVREADIARQDADPARVLDVRLEELIHTERIATFDRVVEAVGLDDVDGLRRYFDRRMDASRAHVGRWRKDVDASRAREVDDRYREILDGLRADGVGGLPIDPDVADELVDA